MRTGYALLTVHGIVLAMGIVFGALAVAELQKTTERMKGIVSDSAQRVIDVERTRAASDRLGLTIRSYLLVQNSGFRTATREAEARFEERLQALARRFDGSESAELVERARALHDRGAAELKRILASEHPLSPRQSIEAVERRGQPLRAQLEVLLDQLSHRETQALEAAMHGATLATAQATRLLSGLAVIGLAIAVGLTIALLRALRLLARNRRELESSLLKLEAANSDLDSFVARAAHDLRNVVSPLPLIAEMLPRQQSDIAALHRLAERLKRVGRTSSGLIETYLTFARAGQPPNPDESSRVRDVLADVIEDLKPMAEQEHAQLEVSGDDAIVLCSQSFLYTILTNLISNGLKYLDGSARREVSVRVREESDVCRISVIDGGPGIPAGSEAKIFEPFYRLPGVRAPGTGIGLATVARIIKAHGGSVTVQSAPGQGSTFTVSLPRADAQSAEHAGEGPPAQSAASSVSSPVTPT
jgi:signal transduction histidine kinase